MVPKSNVLRKNDFEKYEVLLPFSAAIGRRRKSFLCSELEKMHPCFSDEFCFDSTVRKIGKKGLFTDVLVISKRKLAEYEGKRNFTGAGFFAERMKHRFFVNTRLRLVGIAAIACALVIVVSLIYGKVFGNNGSIISDELIKASVSISEKPAVSTPEITVTAASPISNMFFEVLKNSDGKISFFEWKIDGFTETLSASVRGIYPEDLSVLKEFKNRNKVEEFVSYENGSPVMKLFYSQKFSVLKVNIEEKSDLLPDVQIIETSDFNKSLRNIISVNNGVLTEEKAPPYHIEFTCAFDFEVKKIFQEIAELINSGKRRITELTVNCMKDGKCSVGISIEPESPEKLPGFDLDFLSENMKAFESINKKKSSPVTSSVKQSSTLFISPQNKFLKKIGEIKSSDNTTVVFYKNENGKIERRIQKNQ